MSAPSLRPPELSTALAWLPLITLVVCFLIGVTFLGLGAELLVLVMLGAATVAGAIAVRVGRTWDDIQRSTGEKFASVLPVILILLAIGMLIGTWVLSGTIPLLISWGIWLIHPKFLVLTAFLVTAVMSLCTGTSWGSASTLGVALMGTAVAIDGPLAATAGAVVSGAYFGDKLSPLSDSTNICAIGAGADLYAHIRHMLYTALPSFGLALGVYGFAGYGFAGYGFASSATGSGGSETAMPETAQRLLAEIDSAYVLTPWMLLPVLVVIGGVIWKRPPALTLAASSVLAMVLGVTVQGFSVSNALSAAVSGFETGMVATLGLDPDGFSELFVRLLNRGGLYSMTNTLVVILAAFLLAGALDVSGALDKIIQSLLGLVRSTFGLIASTMMSGTVMVSLTSHGGVTALIVGGLFQKAYDERGLAPENLSRSLEDSATLVEPLMPWTVSAIFMATTLGVPTIEYLPWATFCYGGPLFSLLYAATFERTGWGIKTKRAS